MMGKRIKPYLAAKQIVFSLGLVAAASSGAEAYVWKDFGDAYVSCSLGMTCDAEFIFPSSQLATIIAVRRRYGPDQDLAVVIRTTEPILSEDDRIELSIGNRKIGDFYVNQGRLAEYGTELILSDPELATQIIAAVLNEETLVLDLYGQTNVSDILSFYQHARVLEFTDALQDVLGTPLSYFPGGDDVAIFDDIADILEPSDLPDEIWAYYETSESQCGFWRGNERLFRGNSLYLGLEQGGLYILPCQDPGAYNQAYAAFLMTHQGVSKLLNSQISGQLEAIPGAETRLWNVDWDRETKTLTSFYKGTGAGVCGTWSQWTISPDEPDVFELKQVRVNNDCMAENPVPPEKWPLSN